MDDKKRYSDEDLIMFQALIEKKLERAKEQLKELRDTLTGESENGASDTAWQFKADDGSQNSTKDENTILAHKQEVFIESLQLALRRIQNKTYGICVHSGELIDRNRLLAVPNTTTCLVIKNQIADRGPINPQTNETD